MVKMKHVLTIIFALFFGAAAAQHCVKKKSDTHVPNVKYIDSAKSFSFSNTKIQVADNWFVGASVTLNSGTWLIEGTIKYVKGDYLLHAELYDGNNILSAMSAFGNPKDGSDTKKRLKTIFIVSGSRTITLRITNSRLASREFEIVAYKIKEL